MPLTIGTGRTLLGGNNPELGEGPQIISSSTGNNGVNGSTAFIVPAPPSIVVGNLLVAILASGAETYTQPTGWTLYGTKATSGNSPQISVYTKIATMFETVTYAWTCNNGLSDAINAVVLQIAGASQTAPINGMFSSYHASSSTAAVTVPNVTDLPTVLNCLPIAIDSIQQLNLSTTGAPTGLTSGWTGQALAVMIDNSNPGTTGDNNGYAALYVASGPITKSVGSSVSAGWTWGGGFSNFTGTSVMLFIQ